MSYYKRNRRYYKKYYRNTSNNIPPEAMAIAIVIIAIIFAIYFLIEWVKAHPITATIIGILIVASIVTLLVFYIKRKIKRNKEKKLFEKGQIEKGLIRFFDRFNNERWGKPEEVKKWTKEDEEAREKERLINRIIDEIRDFKPVREHHNEFSYQLELTGYLKAKFPNVDIEKTRGSSRPDIVIGDVAIEIKGPTRTEELQTIADKCMRYYQHFGELIIVLFEVNVYEPRYQEWVKGIKNTFSKVQIIRKD